MSAIWLLARAELRRRWPALAALAVLAALGGIVVTSSAALARRTVTSYDRLAAATRPADAEVIVVSSDPAASARAVAALDGVRSSWTAELGVGAIGDQKTYIGMVGSADAPPPGLVHPLVVRGRAPDPAATDEIMVSEDFRPEMVDAGLDLGDQLTLHFLTARDYRSFDTGFGTPGGPVVQVRIVGSYQLLGGTEGAPPVISSRGFVTAHPDALAAGTVVFLRLEDGSAGVAQLRQQLQSLAEDTSVPPGGEEFDPFQVLVPKQARSEFATTARVLGTGLVALGAVAALVALFLLAQGFSRYHSAANDAEAVHGALGVTAAQLLGARLVAAVPTALGAGAAVVVGAVATAGLEPLGSLRAFEPHHGRAVNVTVIAFGAVATVLVVLGVVAATMALATRASRRRRRRAAEAAEPRARRWPAATPEAIGLRFTFGGDRAAAPMRSAIVGVAVAVLGVAGGVVFTSSLDRLVDTPARYGWGGDFSIADADQAAADRLAADPDIAGATKYTQTTVRIGDEPRYVSAYEDLVGHASWWVSSGTLPTAPNQVLLGPRLAHELHVGVGDEIVAGPGIALEVVGTGVGPNFSNSGFGEQALVTPAGGARLAGTAPFTEIVVDVADGRSVERVMDRYGQDYELNDATPPAEIDNLSQLGRLPELLTGFVAVVGIGAVANALWLSVRRRRRDLAVLRVLGHTPGQTGRAVVSMGVLAAAVGIMVGLPLGVAAGRTIWRLVAEGAAVQGDALVSAGVLGGVAVAVLAVALAVAIPAGWLVGRRAPAGVLRAE